MNIRVSDVTKSFGDKKVLSGINLEASSGKSLGVLGRNGAGKTTLARIIMGVFLPDSGEITVDGNIINRDKLKIGYLPEERGLYSKKVIMDQLVYFGVLKNMSKASAVESAKFWLERLEMLQYADKRLDALSKGNQQKIQLIAALISDPDIIILDEPFSGLDPVNAVLLKETVKNLISDNKIVLFSSHQMNYIEEFCDDIAILNKGKIVLSGNIEKIKKSYDRSKMMILSNDNEKLSRILTKESIVEHCGIEKNYLVVKLKSADEKGNLFSKIAQINSDIDEIKVCEPSLNDIFIEYTGDRS